MAEKTKEEKRKEEEKARARRKVINCRKGHALKGGVIVIVDTLQKAAIAERYGAKAVIVIGGAGSNGPAGGGGPMGMPGGMSMRPPMGMPPSMPMGPPMGRPPGGGIGPSMPPGAMPMRPGGGPVLGGGAGPTMPMGAMPMRPGGGPAAGAGIGAGMPPGAMSMRPTPGRPAAGAGMGAGMPPGGMSMRPGGPPPGMMGGMMGMGGGAGAPPPSGGVATRAPDPQKVKEVIGSIMIPVYARVGIGHTIEAAVMGSCHVDGLDEHELLTKASDDSLDYLEMAIPTMSCVEAPTSTPGFGGPGGGPGFGGPMVRPNFGAPGVRPGFGGPGAPAKPPSTTPILDVALKKIAGGVAILRTKAAGTEDTVDITNLTGFMERLDKEYEVVDKLSKEEREEHVKDKGYDVDLLSKVAKDKRLPVPLFAYGGILHPLDVAMVMRLGYNGVIVSKNVFTANNPEKRVRSLVLATIHYKNAKFLAGITEDHGS